MLEEIESLKTDGLDRSLKERIVQRTQTSAPLSVELQYFGRIAFIIYINNRSEKLADNCKLFGNDSKSDHPRQ